MLQPLLKGVAKTWLAGLLLLLPLALTVSVLAWLFGIVYRLVGPGSPVGSLFALLGYPFSRHSELSYLIGIVAMLGVIYLLGLLVQLGLRRPWMQWVGGTVRRIPLVGNLYEVSERFVGTLQKSPRADVAAMRPVWCFFGGGGAAVLGLAPNPEPMQIDGRDYVAVLVPTAPVPIGGALLYAPAEWVREADIGVERLTAIYVSMGMTAPPSPRPPAAVAADESAR